MTDILMDSKHELNYFKIQDPGNCLELKPYQSELEKSRVENTKSVMRSINEVRSDLESLKCEVFKNSKIQNVDNLRKQMFNMEEKITDLKEVLKEELLKLLRNEVNLIKDIQFMERRIEEWAKPIDNHIFKPVKQTSYKLRKTNVDNPVAEFQKFLSHSGGHYGGWEEQDHFLFLKERVKYKKKEKFFSALHCLLPDLSYEMIEEHENWFEKYESLKNNQKEAIKKWKLEKKNQQKQEKEKEENKEEKKHVKKETRQRINIAERIKEWKNQQLLKKIEEEENMKKEKERLKLEEKKKQEMQEMKKLAIKQYKAEKLRKFQEVFLKDDKKLPAQEAKAKNKILLKAFRLQDLKFVEKKKIIRLEIESKSNEKFERLRLTKPALEFILQRDPQRILQPTLIWNQHCLESQKREKIEPIFDLNSIPRLAIPEWRRELK